MLHGCVPVEGQLASRLSAATFYLVLNKHIDDRSRLLDGGEVLRQDVYETRDMVGDLMDVELDVSSTAVVSWTVFIHQGLNVLGANGEFCETNLDSPFRIYE